MTWTFIVSHTKGKTNPLLLWPVEIIFSVLEIRLEYERRVKNEECPQRTKNPEGNRQCDFHPGRYGFESHSGALTIPFLQTNSHLFHANSHFKKMMRSCFLYEGIMPKSWIMCKEVVQICNLSILLDFWWAMNVSMLFWAKLDFLATVTSHQWLFVRQAEKATLLLPHLETVGSKLKRRTTLETLGNLQKQQEAGKTRNVLVSHCSVSKLSCIIRKLLKQKAALKMVLTNHWSIKGFNALLELYYKKLTRSPDGWTWFQIQPYFCFLPSKSSAIQSFSTWNGSFTFAKSEHLS